MDLNELKTWLIARIKATEDPELLQKLEQLLKASEPYAFEEKEPLVVAEPEVLEQAVDLTNPNLDWKQYPAEVRAAVLRGLEQSKNPEILISMEELKNRMKSWDEE